MLFRLLSCATASLLLFHQFASSAAAPVSKPKLVVAIIVDQFRYDYLTRFRADYHGGFDQFMVQGADFTNAFYEQVPTVTAVGHSIFLSGAMPAVSGIIGNSWYDREEGKVVTSVCDWDEKQVGGGHGDNPGPRCTDADPASPKRMLVSTLGDELRVADSRSKVVGISIKARGAILPSGHSAAGAYWFDDESGNFITSTFYRKELPAWADAFNGKKLAAQYVDRAWDGFPKWSFHAPAGGHYPYLNIPASPWGNELIEGFAEAALQGEQMGQRGVTDLLTVSFSSNDYVGHRAGPDSPEVRDMAIRTDALLAKLFKRINETVGMKNTLVVLSADHGVAPTPAQDETTKIPGGYLHADLESTVTNALNKKFGAAEWVIPKAGELGLYFNYEAFKNVKREEVFSTAREAILMNPKLHVVRVYTRDQLDSGMTGDFITRAVMNGYYPRRSSDLYPIFEPGYMSGSSGTNHFSPYAYDRHVPVLFLGPGIKAGRYDGAIAPNDIAPTLATMLSIQTPNGSSGRVLTEMLTPH